MSALYVPVHLDALALQHGRQVIGPTADFEILPWFDGTRDRYPATANLAGAITAEPFADHALQLQPGVHLHWTLPGGLTRGTSDREATRGVAVGELRFPPAPNRWLVVNNTAQRSWIVESDFVHPPDSPSGSGVAYPLNDDIVHRDRSVTGRRYVHLGRQVALTAAGWVPSHLRPHSSRPGGDVFLPDIDAPLTALGHLEPTFAALYANCRTVFGAHDPVVATGEVTYTVIGWYSDDVGDPLTELRTEMNGWSRTAMIGRLNAERVRQHALAGSVAELDLLDGTAELTDLDRRNVYRLAIAERFGWEFDDTLSLGVADRIVCYGTVVVNPTDTTGDVDSRQIVHEPIGVGNTATEALAALLAGEHDDPELEQQLEAVHMGVSPDHHALDLQAKFREQRHSLQFAESGRRRLWMIRDSNRSAGGAAAPELSADLLDALHDLNKNQHEFDLVGDAVDSARQQTYSDWHRAMRATYASPQLDDDSDDDDAALDIDELHALIDQHDLAPLEAALRDRGTLRIERRDAAAWTAISDEQNTAAGQLTERILSVSTRLDDFNAVHDVGLELVLAPGPRFWRPRDPVVCLNHALLTTTKRYRSTEVATAGEPLTVRLGNDFDTSAAFGVFDAMLRLVGAVPQLLEAESRPRQGASTWNPLLLEWEAEVEAIAIAGNLRAAGASYDPDFVRRHYELPESQPEVVERSDPALAPTVEYLSGRTILHPGTPERLAARIDETIARLTASNTDVPDALIRTLGDLRGGGYDAVLTQSLGGFHDGLLMLRNERQLAVDDPIGFATQRRRAARVRDALGSFVPATPVPDAPFHPIRSGEMSIQRLRIVDSFGQTVEWRPSELHGAQPFRHAFTAPARNDRPDRCVLPLRISQGARLDMRWLAADSDTRESTDHSATSPICGWLLTDDLDGALFVYAADGDLLGSIGSTGRWRSAPGSTSPILNPYDIDNAHLAERVTWITEAENPASAVEGMIDAIDTAMESIDPVDLAQHRSRAVLVGRPVALVRAQIGFSLQGHASTDQSWETLRHRMLAGPGAPDARHGFTDVRFPIRLGGHDQLNDGVVGYWVEHGRGTLAQHFVAPHGSRVDSGPVDDRVDVHESSGIDLETGLIWKSIDDDAVTVSLLVDPRAAVHATTGILPVKVLTIPPTQFARALKSMRITFPTMPILTPNDAVTVAVPSEPGFAWAWLQPQRTGWKETPEQPTIDFADFATAYPVDPAETWNELIDRKIIQPTRQSRGAGRLVLPTPDQPAIEPKLLRALTAVARSVQPGSKRAEFGRPTVIRDGWLQLRPIDDAQNDTGTQNDPITQNDPGAT